jgi:hypothetical protein
LVTTLFIVYFVLKANHVHANLDRPSTKLHAPPGGKSSIFLGDDYKQEPRFKSTRSNNISNLSSISFGDSSVADNDMYGSRKNTTPSVMGNIISGSKSENVQPSSGRRGGNQYASSMGNLINGGDDNQPVLSGKGKRQVLGRVSTTIIVG